MIISSLSANIWKQTQLILINLELLNPVASKLTCSLCKMESKWNCFDMYRYFEQVLKLDRWFKLYRVVIFSFYAQEAALILDDFTFSPLHYATKEGHYPVRNPLRISSLIFQTKNTAHLLLSYLSFTR